VAGLLLVLVFLVAGFDRHWRWSPLVRVSIEMTADAFVLAAFALIFFVFRANSFAAATVTVENEQQVIDRGPYSVVRHPMYSGAAVLFVATPIALGSLWALVPAVLLCGTLAQRLLDEERYLTAHLPGYREYRQRVRARLIPGIF
jgi:protein-S-isoprenylcysteine O-methyltransferase Ste14